MNPPFRETLSSCCQVPDRQLPMSFERDGRRSLRHAEQEGECPAIGTDRQLVKMGVGGMGDDGALLADGRFPDPGCAVIPFGDECPAIRGKSNPRIKESLPGQVRSRHLSLFPRSQVPPLYFSR